MGDVGVADDVILEFLGGHRYVSWNFPDQKKLPGGDETMGFGIGTICFLNQFL